MRECYCYCQGWPLLCPVMSELWVQTGELCTNAVHPEMDVWGGGGLQSQFSIGSWSRTCRAGPLSWSGQAHAVTCLCALWPKQAGTWLQWKAGLTSKAATWAGLWYSRRWCGRILWRQCPLGAKIDLHCFLAAEAVETCSFDLVTPERSSSALLDKCLKYVLGLLCSSIRLCQRGGWWACRTCSRTTSGGNASNKYACGMTDLQLYIKWVTSEKSTHVFPCLFWIMEKANTCLSLFFWQNQLLAKGLLFIEEKVKLCEGKYSKKPISEWGSLRALSSLAFMFGWRRWFTQLKSIQPFLVLRENVTNFWGQVALQSVHSLWLEGCLQNCVAAIFLQAMASPWE